MDLWYIANRARETLPEHLQASNMVQLAHTDGENKALLPFYPACEFDIAESACPHPMTLCSLKEIRQGLGKKIAVWGGIPSIALMESTMDDALFETYLDQLFEDMETGQGMILGVSDAVPPDAKLSRFEKIRSRIDAFGPVGSGRRRTER